jgi:hypothetical protein
MLTSLLKWRAVVDGSLLPIRYTRPRKPGNHRRRRSQDRPGRNSGEVFSHHEAKPSLVRSASRNRGWLALHRPSRRISISGHRIFWQWNDPWHVFRDAYSRPYYGKSSPWVEFFAPNRKSFSGTLDYLLENKDFLTYFIKDPVANRGSARKAKAVFSPDNVARP